MDATDRPLHFTTPDGERREWPTLTPTSAQSEDASPNVESKGSPTGWTSIRPVVSPSPILAPVQKDAEMTALNSIEQPPVRRRSLSETSSYTTALDLTSAIASATAVALPANATATANVAAKSDINVLNTRATLTRQSVQDLRSHQQNQKYNSAPDPIDMPGRTLSVRGRAASGSLVSSPRSNRVAGLGDFTKIPSPSRISSRASSREPSPSPANFSRPRRGSATSSFRPRSIKTASRIPIADTKKATIVDVKQDRSSISSKIQSADTPRFGSSRLASPEALRVLENGKLRRQMQLEKAEGDVDHAPLQRITTNASDSSIVPTPSLSYSFDTSPEGTTAPGSPEGFVTDGEVQTPGSRLRPANRATRAMLSNEDVRNMFTSESVTRAPPSKSPFTAPLPTIQSQAILPTDPAGFQDAGEENLVRALSHLEGKGSPPTTEVDHETLRQMFGHLKRGKGDSRAGTSPLHHNAAAAERFLAMNDDGTEENDPPAAGAKQHVVDQNAAPSNRNGSNMVSKWSASTPSDKHDDGILHLHSAGGTAAGGDAVLRRTPSNEIESSIGWPSVVPTDLVPVGQGGSAATASSVGSRRSSPTLGTRRYQGSLRGVRDGLRAHPPSLRRTVTATRSEKVSRLPTPSSRLEKVDRGRTVSPNKTAPIKGRSKVWSHCVRLNCGRRSLTRVQAPRSRSKSRIVLDKINGFFSGNRDKKEAVPPVPQIDDSFLRSKPRTRPSITHLGPAPDMPTRPAPPVPARPSQIPKKPSLSPFLHTSPRAGSPSTTFADDATLVDSITLKDESQKSGHALAEHLLTKAKAETNLVRKQRFLTMAQVRFHISLRKEPTINADTLAGAQ